MSTGIKISRERAIHYAERFIKMIEPHVIKCEIGGSIRRKQPMVSDVEIVCTENKDNPLSNLFITGFPGMVKNGDRYKQFKYNSLKIDLFIAQDYDYGRIFAIRTGSSCFAHKFLAVKANRLGWVGTKDGLRRKKECNNTKSGWKIKDEYEDNPTKPPIFDTEEDYFKFLGEEYIPPERRNWTSNDDKYNYST